MLTKERSMKVGNFTDVPGLGERIRTARKLSREPLTVLCDRAGIKRQTWYQIEDEKVDFLAIETLRKIEEVLGENFGVEV